MIYFVYTVNHDILKDCKMHYILSIDGVSAFDSEKFYTTQKLHRERGKNERSTYHGRGR